MCDVFGQLVSEYIGGNWSRDYIADGSGDLIATENASGLCTTYYFGTDHLGSVRIVMDQSGGVVARHDYLPFGEELLNTAGRTTLGFNVTSDVTQKFTGQVRDSESGQDYFNARYFMAPLGRFNSVDPGNAGASLMSSQSWNGYGYVLGNPLGLVDPSGMCPPNPDQPCFGGNSKPACKWWQIWCWAGSSGGTPEEFDQVSTTSFLNAPSSCSNCGAAGGGTSAPPVKTGTNSSCPSQASQIGYASLLFGTLPNQMFLSSLAAAKTGGTAMFGVSASAAVGLPGNPNISRALAGQAVIATDAAGNVGLVLSGAVGGAAGEGIAAGTDIGISRAKTIFDLSGPSYSLGFGGGRGLGGALQASNNGGATLTLTAGRGLGGYAPGVTYGPTLVVPLVCAHK
jgi:RHS repeat-associated protein